MIRTGQDQSWLAKNGQDWSGLIRTGQDRSGMVRNGKEWSGLGRIGKEQSGLVRIGLDWTELVRTSQDWSGMIRTGQYWSGLVMSVWIGQVRLWQGRLGHELSRQIKTGQDRLEHVKNPQNIWNKTSFETLFDFVSICLSLFQFLTLFNLRSYVQILCLFSLFQTFTDLWSYLDYFRLNC